MQPQQGSRINLGELKAQIVKKIGSEKSKRYFYFLSRFLSHKLSKSEFDKSCYRLLGRENLPLHNQLIVSILKNASQAKSPPRTDEAEPAKSVTQITKNSPCREDGLEQGGSLLPNQNQNLPIWSNGILPLSPRKCRSGIRDRKLRDRPSPLGPNGKVECLYHQTMGTEESGGKFCMENGVLTPCDYQRPLQHLPGVAEQCENEREGLVLRTTGKGTLPCRSQVGTALAEGAQEVGQANPFSLPKAPLLAPLGIPLCPASAGGARKATAVTNTCDSFSCYDTDALPDSETLRKHMEQIAAAQGLGGVSVECANMLNSMLDVFLKKLIKSCVELVGTRTARGPRKYPVHEQQIQNRVLNGAWPGNDLHTQVSSGPLDVSQEQRPQQHLVSLLDFRVAMELNPQQLGEDWPLLLEKICMHSFEE